MGLSNTALSYVVYVLLVEVVPYRLAGALAFAAGAVNGYVLNRRWTFRARDSTASRLRYLAVQLSGLGTTTVLLSLYVSVAGLDRLWAYALTIPAVTVATFAANRTWTFETL